MDQRRTAGDNFDINHGSVPRGKGTEVGTILQLQTCPYNESHRVGHGSFAKHLNNCRMQLTPEEQGKFMICEYNATHHMNKEVYEDHLKICADFRYFEADQYYLPPEYYGHHPAQKPETEKDVADRDALQKKLDLEAEMRRRRDEDDRISRRVVTEKDKRQRDLAYLRRAAARHAALEEEYMESF